MMIDNNRKKDDNRGEGNMLKWKKALRISRMFLLFLIVAVLIPEDVLITAAKAQTVVDTQQGTEDVILDDNEKAETKQEELSTEEEDTPEPEPLLRGLIRDEKGVLTRKIDKNKKMVALTYDDGPSIYTPRVLTTLKKNDAVATFFVVGNRVPTYSDTVKKAYDMGCEIGNHTYEHKSLPRLSEAGVKEQMSRTDEAVKKVTGQTTVIMRPTGGATNENVKKWVGKPSIIWSIDTLDWKTRNADSTKRAVLNHVKDGEVVLMHDLYSATASASETIIPELVKRGYQLVTVSELAECRGGMKETGAYFSFRK